MSKLDNEWVIGNGRCISQYEDSITQGYCNPVWDRFLCWPPTSPGEIARLRCPQSKGTDTSKFAFRKCNLDGLWQGRGISSYNTSSSFNNSFPNGWTNYTLCFPPGVRDLLAIWNSQSEDEAERKLMAAQGTRILEMVGLVVSITTLLTSLYIFGRFSNLWNNRTRIHKNLFIAMCIQVLVRLVVYTDQYISRAQSLTSILPASNFSSDSDPDSSTVSPRGIENTAYVCEGFYTVLEYARTSMFLWMFVEGLYLHNMITVAVFQERINIKIYYWIGWGAPVFLTSIWAVVTALEFKEIVCWWGYNLSSYYWILEGPRLTVIALNLIFLLNIIRVLVTKLRESNSTEAHQVRQAVRAALVLLPLLGITNSIQMVHSPVDKNAVLFAIWSYGTAFLTSFQGFFCALIYCFLNGEVQIAIKRFLHARKHHANVNYVDDRRRSNSMHTKLHKKSIKKSPPAAESELEMDKMKSKHLVVDPIKEYWNEADLSSHNVDIEDVEIPAVYFQKRAYKTQLGTTTKAKDNCIINEVQNESSSNFKSQA